jgi:hypothetical protein
VLDYSKGFGHADASRPAKLPSTASHAARRSTDEARHTAFPEGKHDDQVDALGLVGQLMDRYVPGYIPKKPDTEKWPGYVVQGDTERNDNNWKTL